MPSKDELENQGWQAASISSGEHLRRTLEMYRELGLDTHIEEVSPEQCGGCTECFKAGGEPIYRIYTRPRSEPA